jgi:hypothetical protein
MWGKFFVSVFAFSFGLCSFAYEEKLPAECAYDKECVIELPGSQCADGTQSYLAVTRRQGADSILIFFNGGGACWDDATCDGGLARSLTRVEPRNDWVNGEGIRNANDPLNPFAKKFTKVVVPYCTGDLHLGDTVANYGSSEDPYVIRHHGYTNAKLALQEIHRLFSHPRQVVLAGGSAGGIGVTYHLQNFAEIFIDTEKFVLNDAGLPFEPPYVLEQNYDKVMNAWGAQKNFPKWGNQRAKNLGDVVEFNTKNHPSIPYAFISGDKDLVMTFFAMKLGSKSPFRTVKDTMDDIANNRIGNAAPNQRVFYLPTSVHTFLSKVLSDTNSVGKNLGEWLTAMLNGKGGWENVQPRYTPPDIHEMRLLYPQFPEEY